MRVLRYGKNEQLRRIAQEIIVDQMQEIAAMSSRSASRAADHARADPRQLPARRITTSGMQWHVHGMKH